MLAQADFAAIEAPGIVLISAIIEVAKDAVLFGGILDESYIDFESQLDRLVLQNIARRPLWEDKRVADASEEIGAKSEVSRFSEN